jgi:hypothetical protein
MALLTAYDLPFSMTVPAAGDLARGGDFNLRVALTGVLTEPGLEALGAIVTSWGVLANTGAMSGEHLAASTSGIKDWTNPIPGAGSVTWALSNARLDDRAAIVLAHLLLSEWDALKFGRVDLFSPTNPQATTRVAFDPQVVSPYPGIDRGLRFPVDIDDEIMESATVRIVFSAVPDDAQREDVSIQLLTWAAVACAGAYPIAPSHPYECSFIADEDLEWVDEEMSWGLARVRVHGGAFSGLANVVGAIDQSVLAVRELSIA